MPAQRPTWLVGLLAAVAAAHGQDAPFSVRDAVLAARRSHPALRAARARGDAAIAAIRLARVAYIPKTDLHLQEVRGTRNNLSGLSLPQPVFPQISGAVLPGSSGVSRWDSGVGVLLNWEPFDFGWRRARTDVAVAEARQTEAGVDTTLLDLESTAAEAFLAGLADDQIVRASRAGVERMQVFARTVRQLADSELRAGADAARAEAELARARTQLAQAEQAAAVAREVLAEAVGAERPPAALAAGPLLEPPAALPEAPAPGAITDHPLVRAQAAAVATAHARQHLVETSAMPHVNLVASLSSRGSGFQPDGQPDPDSDRGLVPTVPNWAVGAELTVPLHERYERRERRRVEAGQARAEQARLEEVALAVGSQQRRAQALLTGARRVAAEAAVQLTSAQTAQAQARSRYDQGLNTVSDVAEAELLLARAEADDAVACLGVWRGLLAVARAGGSIDGWVARAAGAPVPAADIHPVIKDY